MKGGRFVEPFVMQIAGLVAQVQPMFMSTREYCRAYLTDKKPEFFVETKPEDLEYEQKLLDLEAEEEGMKRRKFTDPFLERNNIQRKIAFELLNRKTILLHGSTVGLNGAAYLFTAPCGTGKSTHTRLWRETFGNRAVMVNDDKTFLELTPKGVLAYGSPWGGKFGLETNICLPLKGICILRRGSENVIYPMNPEDALEELKHQTLLPDDPEGQAQGYALVEELAQKVNLWDLQCTKEPEAARVSYGAMSKSE